MNHFLHFSFFCQPASLMETWNFFTHQIMFHLILEIYFLKLRPESTWNNNWLTYSIKLAPVKRHTNFNCFGGEILLGRLLKNTWRAYKWTPFLCFSTLFYARISKTSFFFILLLCLPVCNNKSWEVKILFIQIKVHRFGSFFIKQAFLRSRNVSRLPVMWIWILFSFNSTYVNPAFTHWLKRRLRRHFWKINGKWQR